MTTRFLFLAIANATLLLVSYFLGWHSRWNEGVARMDVPYYTTHFLFGLLTALWTLLVHCIIFTYFLGTGRWVKEVGLVYKLEDSGLPRRTRELKRRVFPPALYAMLITIATGAAGQGAQMGMWHWGIHFALATATLVVNFWAFRIEYQCLEENGRVLDQVMAEVNRIRADLGLNTNEEALLEQE